MDEKLKSLRLLVLDLVEDSCQCGKYDYNYECCAHTVGGAIEDLIGVIDQDMEGLRQQSPTPPVTVEEILRITSSGV
jgi:hypothetical protein